MTERHPLNTLATKQRIEAEWEPWFGPGKPWRMEKSPVNLVRLRLLQGLFPLSQFVVITRHPLRMAQALEKWSPRSTQDLAAYGVSAYARMLDDVRHLHCAMVLRYEDLVRQPRAIVGAIEAFIDCPPRIVVEGIRDGNADYPFVPGPSGTIAALGYADDGAIGHFEPIVRHTLRRVRENCRAMLDDPATGRATSA
jgi:hypothetical protein